MKNIHILMINFLPPTHVKVEALEDEVSRLKGELAAKAEELKQVREREIEKAEGEGEGEGGEEEEEKNSEKKKTQRVEKIKI